ncbi:spermidine/putrescine ABC transporter substrate-binding protein [Xinfangfangia sp. CPCC 101601]|uniref:Putrescine-binding periplasmic protein n=1 Tax=Pseudogemmobacter lacusdianii TaxID=3069608 RepID=A0ABU0W0E0_9RHOB|nr:spermidine/putrescine ABC transporter substrate-binding protein [Xinfangfangia sp. CPCC 101601]MDQ2067461.1 spermidine/putrescine ABC transporter substrate-binding protein [Xinfangfangia sp. CPCC 101601]
MKTMAWAIALTLSPAGAQAEGHLSLYNWLDYISPQVLVKFTEETGITVRLESYTSNEEMLAKIQAGTTSYDIVFPSVHMNDIMLRLGLLDKTGINTHPDFKNIDPSFLRTKLDSKGEYCLPYAWGTVGIFYNEAQTGPIASWEEFFAIPKKGLGPIALLDDKREVLAIGHFVNGTSVNSTDPDEIRAAADYILAQEAQIATFDYEAPTRLEDGPYVAAQAYVGMNAFYQDRPQIKYVIPTEGATMYQENMCVLASAPNRANAIKFMEFYLRPEIAALNVSHQFNSTPNIPANVLTPEAIRSQPSINVQGETHRRLQILEDLGTAIEHYDRAWNAIRPAP